MNDCTNVVMEQLFNWLNAKSLHKEMMTVNSGLIARLKVDYGIAGTGQC